MGTVSTNEFRKKLKIMVDGQPYEIIENQFVKPGKGQALTAKLRKLKKSPRKLSMAAKFGSSMALLSKSLGGRTRRRWLHFRSKLSRRPSLT